MSEHGTTDFTGDHRTEVERTGRAGHVERYPDPGLPPHVHRRTDVDPRAARRAERQVAGLFILSILASLVFCVAYVMVDLNGDVESVSLSTKLLGGGLAVSLFCVGVAAVHWAKKLMPDDEVVEERHPIRSTDDERAGATALVKDGGAAAGFGRRKLIWASLTGAMAAFAAPTALLFRDLWFKGDTKPPYEQLEHTVWERGMRLVQDPTLRPIKAAEITVGSVVHVLPELKRDGEATDPKEQESGESAEDPEHGGLTLNEMTKAPVLLIRLRPEELEERPDRKDWSYNGIVAYSKICTHVGCPVALYEQTTHHLLCPCHQSTFDVTSHCDVVFGPAARALPQLAITVDDEGYLVAQGDFNEPVGPSYWERG